ncbi:beta-N-acetylhexosaminidase [Paenibacillus alvei]|uniref:Beta-N-acetylhexosaminidase n=1 Tax=Paenibacillus alvei TaxID=44250 RepID=A0ABT4GRW0_PAEAL|nr:beta-N-acetylhexosaminidase [Paenibacillus alvei]MCY7485113.1 beta-N-acetylhexosaminidase [Paenibacillus alvei]MCY9759430.1 beta-N-acetylhexosaminidase [Paenibacillus alvei]MCY9766226.1 beta-N-acetylhexosaminidase [Paenibacillus alvei]
MKLQFIGSVEQLLPGIQELQSLLNMEAGTEGTLVRVEQEEGPLRAAWDGTEGVIRYEADIHFFRALGLFVEQLRKGKPFDITEHPQFTYNGTMIDASRNAVPNVHMMKQTLRSMALMGLNGAMLYTEDTYEVPGRPYFGYMRGRYSAEELYEIDQYAAMFGIEVVACIQTLGHLAQALKWDYANEMKDTEDVLLVGEEETYRFIEDMVVAATKSLRSKRIHIGMDEAFGLGLGKYMHKHGFRERFDIMNEHLARVLEITGKHGLTPMMWSDMYFHLLMKNGGHYYDLDINFTNEVVDQIPKGVQFVYWDYYHDDQGFYEEFIEKHRQLGSDPVFAGGVWVWGAMSPNYGKTWQNTNPALLACKSKGIQEVFATAWGDNGQETNHMTILPGLQLFAEHGYTEGEVDEVKLKERFQLCTGQSFDDYWQLTYLDETPGVTENNMHGSNGSKFLLFQDALLGLFDIYLTEELEAKLPKHYKELAQRLAAARDNTTGDHALVFDMYAKLSAAVGAKSMLGVQVTRAYRNGDKEELRRIATEVIPMIRPLVDEARKAHRALWMATSKPFGWEVIDSRYGTVMARLQSAEERILDFVDERVACLEELEQERLPFYSDDPVGEHRVAHQPFFHRIVTGTVFSAI